MQWILLSAQLATWGQVRSTYEAVDMREYQAGRTGSFRPHTAAAVRFCRGLLVGSASFAEFEAARAAHSSAIKTVKTGGGWERHLYGLEQIARRSGISAPIFADQGYQTLLEDFLSTTSLGTAEHITRLAFAPSLPDGIGVNYTRTDAGYEFCLSYDAELRPDIDQFAANLEEGARTLRDYLAAGAGGENRQRPEPGTLPERHSGIS